MRSIYPRLCVTLSVAVDVGTPTLRDGSKRGAGISREAGGLGDERLLALFGAQ